MALRAAHVATLIIAGLGMVFLCLGGWWLSSDSADQEVARVAALPVFDAGSWKKATVGTTVLLEGHIGAGTPAVFRDFVACRREKYAGRKGTSSNAVERWDLIGVVAPPLSLEARGAQVAVVNPGYALRGALHDWRDEHVAAELFKTEGERASGLVVGDRVVAEGRVLESGLEAVLLFGGGAEAYREDTRSAARVGVLLGKIFATVGGLLVAVGAVIGWRARSSRLRKIRA